MVIRRVHIFGVVDAGLERANENDRFKMTALEYSME